MKLNRCKDVMTNATKGCRQRLLYCDNNVQENDKIAWKKEIMFYVENKINSL